MKTCRLTALFPGLVALLAGVGAHAATIQVILATDQIPADAETFRVASVSGGIWDRGGRILLSGRYRPGSPGAVDRNAAWVSSGPGTTRELYADGDSVPYYSGPAVGPVIAMSVPIVQPRFRGYVPPASFWAWQSSVVTRLPEIPEGVACWVDWLEGVPGMSPTIFVVNDLEEHIDGAVRFVRPEIEGAIIQERASTAGLGADVTYMLPGGGGAQIYVNGSYSGNASGRSGSVVWIARSGAGAVASERRGAVQMIAASSGMGLPSLPGGAYSSIRVLGVDPAESLLWEVGGDDGIGVLRGDLGAWTPTLMPGMAAPAVRGGAPSATTPIGRLDWISLVEQGAGILTHATYASTAGDMANRATLLMHDGTAPRLMAFAREIVEGTAPGTRVQNLSVGGQDAPDRSQVAFIGSVVGGTQPFETQALLLANEFGVRLLARQHDPLPVPTNVDRIVRFRLPVVSATPGGRVAFVAEVDFMDGSRRDILYAVTPGLPNRYEVMLAGGDTFTIQTPEGPRIGTVRRVNDAQWRPGTFDSLLVSVDLVGDGTSAVLLLVPDAPAPVPLDAEFLEGRLRLRWPLGVEGAVEVSSSLALGSWTLLDVPVSVVDGMRQADLPVDGAAQFFRFR
jgi:hypothetical protein